MIKQATGTFEVTLTPQGNPDAGPGATLGRMLIDKQFHGDLVAAGKGEMLTAMTKIDGSAGYVAIERVTGTLDGRQGSFVFQHTGHMNRGTQQLIIVVVADSGSGQLIGLAGELAIAIKDGQHFYTFDYSLPDQM